MLRRYVAGNADVEHGYQGSENNNEIGPNDYYTHYRTLNTNVARWEQVDPKALEQMNLSPYLSMNGNPVLYNDVLGDISGGPGDPPRNGVGWAAAGVLEGIGNGIISQGKGMWHLITTTAKYSDPSRAPQLLNKAIELTDPLNTPAMVNNLKQDFHNTNKKIAFGDDFDRGQVMGETAFGVGTALGGGEAVGLKLLSAAGKESAVARTISKVASIFGKETTVLGSYGKTGEYVAFAKSIKANYFSIEKSVWDKMTDAERWTANTNFLDAAIKRGDSFKLSHSAFEAQKGTFFYKEIEYMKGKGYSPSSDGMQLIKK